MSRPKSAIIRDAIMGLISGLVAIGIWELLR